MSLIPCPECKSKVSDSAVSCPKCGFPIEQHVEAADQGVFAPPESADIESREIPEPSARRPEHLQVPLADTMTSDLPETSKSAPKTLSSGEALSDAKPTKTGPTGSEDEVSAYKGIGPWLRILCFFLIAQPIWEFFGLYGEVSRADMTGEFATYVYSNYALAGLKFLIGISLFAELRQAKNWGTIKLTASLLWFSWPAVTAAEYLILPKLFLGDLISFESGSSAVAIGSVGLSCGFAMSWTAYLFLSKRIAVTYRKDDYLSKKKLKRSGNRIEKG